MENKRAVTDPQEEAARISTSTFETHTASNETHTRLQKCRFLNIANELRNEIYGLALICGEPVRVHAHSPSPASHDLEPGLLKTCQQIRREALSLYYSCNIFQLECKLLIQPNIDNIAYKLHMLRIMHIYVDGLCSHSGRYFMLDVTKGIDDGMLLLIRSTGKAWKEGDHGCSKADLLSDGKKYLENSITEQRKTDILTAKVLQGLLAVLMSK